MAKELKKRRDEAKQARENAAVVIRTAKKVSDFTGVRKAHDEAEKLRVESTPFYAEDAQVVEVTIAQRPQKP